MKDAAGNAVSGRAYGMLDECATHIVESVCFLRPAIILVAPQHASPFDQLHKLEAILAAAPPPSAKGCVREQVERTDCAARRFMALDNKDPVRRMLGPCRREIVNHALGSCAALALSAYCATELVTDGVSVTEDACGNRRGTFVYRGVRRVPLPADLDVPIMAIARTKRALAQCLPEAHATEDEAAHFFSVRGDLILILDVACAMWGQEMNAAGEWDDPNATPGFDGVDIFPFPRSPTARRHYVTECAAGPNCANLPQGRPLEETRDLMSQITKYVTIITA
jgi:hypothetical protein